MYGICAGWDTGCIYDYVFFCGNNLLSHFGKWSYILQKSLFVWVTLKIITKVPTKTKCQLHVFLTNSDAIRVQGAQVGVLKNWNKVCFSRGLEVKDSISEISEKCYAKIRAIPRICFLIFAFRVSTPHYGVRWCARMCQISLECTWDAVSFFTSLLHCSRLLLFNHMPST